MTTHPSGTHDTAAFGDAITTLLQVLDRTADAVFLFDSKWQFQYVNAAGCTMLRRKREALLGENGWQLFPELRHTESAQNWLSSSVSG